MILLFSGCRDTFLGPSLPGEAGVGHVVFNALTVTSQGPRVGPVTAIALDGTDRRFLYDIPTMIESMPRKGKVAYYEPTNWSTDFGRAIVSNIDGSDPRMIAVGVSGITAVMAPVVLAPDGMSVAYILRDIATVTNSLCVADLNGTVLHQVPINCSCDIYHLEFSPDSRLIAYVGTDDPRRTIQIVDLPSASTYSIGNNVGFSFTWSPDGTRLAYSQGNNLYYQLYPDMKADSLVVNSSINLVDVGGRHITQILQDTAEVFDLGWSPSGTTIAYARRSDASPNFHADLWLINASGSSRRQLTTSSAAAKVRPRWTSDGRALIFTSIPDPTEGGGAQSPSVQRFDLVTSASKMIADRAFGGMSD